ncbi:MAG: hypothetical protein K6A93_01260 [Bacteroidaceae bacterium]|jgi:hypothetical protein|nr:hypothetical protein [Bacteroidaceae bacterium]
MGQVKMRKAAQTLHFNEGKPQGYHLTQLVYAPIKEKDLIKYMAPLTCSLDYKKQKHCSHLLR